MRYKVLVINEAGAERYKACGITAGMRVSSMYSKTVYEGPFYVFNNDRFYPAVELAPHEFCEYDDFIKADGIPHSYTPVFLPYPVAGWSPIPSGGVAHHAIVVAAGVLQMVENENTMIGLNQMQRDAMMLMHQIEHRNAAKCKIGIPTLYSTHGSARLSKQGAKRLHEFGGQEGMYIGRYRRDKKIPTPLVPSSETYTFAFNQGVMIRCHFDLDPGDTYVDFEYPDMRITAPLLAAIYPDKLRSENDIDITRQTVFGPFYDYRLNVHTYEATVPRISAKNVAAAKALMERQPAMTLAPIPQLVDVYYSDGRPLGEWYRLPKPDWMHR